MAYIKSTIITKLYTLGAFSANEIGTLKERKVNELLRYDD